jgi:HAD superfamily hydrolase (TIGR01509 family)
MIALFDLDGVLVDFKQLHKKAFILAWNTHNPEFQITLEFHDAHLEALPTRDKIQFCAAHFNIPLDLSINISKQKLTKELMELEPVYPSVTHAIQTLAKDIRIGCCSNSIKQTVERSLDKLHCKEFFEVILSNEDVKEAKPSPQIYEKAMQLMNVTPDDCVIFEDSEVGIQAAKASGAHVVRIVDSLDITYEFLRQCIQYKTRIPPTLLTPSFRINLVIPMAGLGSRFQKEGYTIQKPFLPVFGHKMYKWVIQNLMPSNALKNFLTVHIIIREDQKDNLKELQDDTSIHVHTVPGLTEGPACTVLSVKEIINVDYPLVIANSDQYLEWNVDAFYDLLLHPSFDGVFSTFEQPNELDIKWSYAKVNSSSGRVCEVAEKRYISSHASTGIYGWKKGSDFVKYTEQMIEKNIRVNKEFYVTPVYNEAILESKEFRTHSVNKMWGLGIPQDYEYFLANFKNRE